MKKKTKMILMVIALCITIVQIADLKGYSQNTDKTTDNSTQTEIFTPVEKTSNDINGNNGNNGNGKPVIKENGNLFSTLKKGRWLMIVLVLLGLASLTLVIERIIYFTKHNVWQHTKLNDLLNNIASQSKAVYREDLEDDLKAFFQIYASKMERGLALLSGIGNLSPIVGFLGTVTGMISAFASIANATTVNAKVVAVGIQEALITTAGGLTVAVPTLAFFYLFTHVIQNRYSQANGIINKLCESKQRITDTITDK